MMKLARTLIISIGFLVVSIMITLILYLVYLFVDMKVANYILYVMMFMFVLYAAGLSILGITVKVSPETRIERTNHQNEYKDTPKYKLCITYLDRFIYSFCSVRQSRQPKEKTSNQDKYHNDVSEVVVKQPILQRIHTSPLRYVIRIIWRHDTKCK